MLAYLIPDLLDEVLQHLQFKDFQNLMCVDKAHHEAFQPLVLQNIKMTYEHLQSKQSLDGLNFEMFHYAHTIRFKDYSPLELIEGDEPTVDKDVITKNFERVLRNSNPDVLFLHSCNITTGLFTTIGRLSNLVELNMISSTTSDDDILVVCDHVLQLTNLKIDGSPAVTDRALESIANLTALEGLQVSGSSITDEGMEKISSLACLTELDVSFCNKLTMEGFRYLTSVRLLTLKMSGLNTIDMSGVSNVASITSLRSLHIRGNPVREHVCYLARLGELRELDVSDCLIGDTGMHYIAKLNQLEKVNLSGNPITDPGLLPLVKLTSLQELDIEKCKGITGKYFTLKDSPIKSLDVPFKLVSRRGDNGNR